MRLHVTPLSPRTRHHARPSLLNLVLAALMVVGGSWKTLDLLYQPPDGWSLMFWAPVVGCAVGVGVVLATREARRDA